VLRNVPPAAFAVIIGAPILFALILLAVFVGGAIGAVLLDLWEWLREEDPN
jgi:hypothetical protein